MNNKSIDDDGNNYNVRHDSCELYNNNNNRGNVRK